MKLRILCFIFIITTCMSAIAGCSDNKVQSTAQKTTAEKLINTQADVLDIPQTILEFITNQKGKNASEISNSLNNWAGIGMSGTDFWITSTAAEKSDPSLPDALLISFSRNGSASKGYAVYWWEGEVVKYSVFKCGGSVYTEFSDQMTVISSRISRSGNGSMEMGAIFDGLGYGNGGFSKPWPVYKLLRLEKDSWKVLWSSPGPGAPQEDWQNNHGIITFSSKDISEFILEGDSLLFKDGKEKILSQTKLGSMRYFRETWSRQGDEYILKKSETIPTAFNTLLEFIYSISKGDDKTALKCVKDKSLINKAKELGLVQKSLDSNWPVAYPQGSDDNEKMRAAAQLTIVLDQEKQIRINVDFIKKDNQFLISGLNK